MLSLGWSEITIIVVIIVIVVGPKELPSLLKLKAYQNDSNAFIHDQSNKLKFYYSFIKMPYNY